MKLTIKIKKPDLAFLQRGKNFENIFNGILIKTSKQVGLEIVKLMRKTMETGGYAPNESKYLFWKTTSGYGTEPLFRTNLLANSIASETKINLPNSIGGEVGWHSGARYPGNLQSRQWKRGVPKRRKKDLGIPFEVEFKSHYDTNTLAQVAAWNEFGAWNGVEGEKRQERPFVKDTFAEAVDIVYERYVDATHKAFARVYGGKSKSGASGVPF